MEKNLNKNSKQRILKVAAKLFANKGYDGTSIREICRLANTNICMISYYWGGKRELYKGLIEDLIDRQTEYAKSFIDLEKNPNEFSKNEQIDILMLIIDKFVDFFYSKISKELLIILLKEQQNEYFVLTSPAIRYLRKLLASIFEKDENEKQIIFRTLFIAAQVNSARIMPAFSLRLLGQDDFLQEDIKIIKENVKLYINALLKESNIV